MERAEFDTSRRVPGQLSYIGDDASALEFSFDEVIKGIRSLDGVDRCGLHFERGSPVQGEQDGQVVASNWRHPEIQPVAMSGEIFCVGGGSPDGYICCISTLNGEMWLNTRDGDADDLREIRYDCGCDIELGIFPGKFIIPYVELLEAARCFFSTGQMTDKSPWINRENMGFDPWYRD